MTICIHDLHQFPQWQFYCNPTSYKNHILLQAIDIHNIIKFSTQFWIKESHTPTPIPTPIKWDPRVQFLVLSLEAYTLFIYYSNTRLNTFSSHKCAIAADHINPEA